MVKPFQDFTANNEAATRGQNLGGHQAICSPDSRKT
jgi:hypothetical protein